MALILALCGKFQKPWIGNGRLFIIIYEYEMVTAGARKAVKAVRNYSSSSKNPGSRAVPGPNFKMNNEYIDF